MLRSRVLPFYLVRSVGLAVVLAALALTLLYTTIDLVRESAALGGDYGFGRMLLFLVMTLPTRLYDVFPFAALIGSLMALGFLAAAGEVVAMRAGGFDRMHIMGWALAAVVLVGSVVIVVGETLMPTLESSARIDREQARSGEVSMTRTRDFWLRDGDHMVTVDLATWDDDQGAGFAGVTLYELDPDMGPRAVIRAPRAIHREGSWHLEGASRLILGPDASQSEPGLLRVQSRIDSEMFTALAARPRLLSMPDLTGMIAYLEANGLDADTYRYAFWRRIFYPAYLVAMLLAGIPLVLRSGQDFSPGLAVFSGICLGLVFFVASRMSQGLALVWPLPLWISALLPVLPFAILGYWLLRRP